MVFFDNNELNFLRIINSEQIKVTDPKNDRIIEIIPFALTIVNLANKKASRYL